MAGAKQITNPNAAFGQTDADSNQFQIVAEFTAATALALGDAVAVVWSETARTLTAVAADSDTSAYYGIGVAKHAAATGESVSVVVFGFALANIGSDTPALYENLVLSSTAGTFASVAAAETTVAGSIVGQVIGDEDGTTNLCPVWVSPR